MLRFTPYAWSKLVYLRDLGPTEVGGFGISAADDLSLVEDVHLVKQTCTATAVAFDDESVADFFDEQVDRGLTPQQFGRIWLHTHPGNSAEPSWTDEETFSRCFGGTEWSVMFILAREGQHYSRLRFNVGPTASMDMDVQVDYGGSFAGSSPNVWQKEYDKYVSIAKSASSSRLSQSLTFDSEGDIWGDEQDFLDAWNAYLDDRGVFVGGGGFHDRS